MTSLGSDAERGAPDVQRRSGLAQGYVVASGGQFDPDEVILIEELNHRLFNTLQVVMASVARLRKALCAPEAASRLNELESRVLAFANLHRLLSCAIVVDGLENHCRRLCIELIKAFGREDMTPWVRMADVPLSPGRSLRVALLVVELVTNVLKHGLGGPRGGVVFVDLIRTRCGRLELAVRESHPHPSPDTGLRPRIVDTLAESLAGSALITTRDGYETRVRFPCE